MAAAVEQNFLVDTGSLKSFKQLDDFASAPLSPRATSLKSKRSRLKMSALHRRMQAESGDLITGGMKNKDCNTPSPKPLPGHKPEEMSHMRASCKGTENNVRSQNRPKTTQRNPTRSKTILRLFSSKFFVRSTPTTPAPFQPLLRSPTQIISAFGSKETRDAALRERGLLPPLKPNVDFSSAERERDYHLPVLTPPLGEETFTLDDQGRKISAAAKVKQEWEAQHKDAKQLERMKSYTFGGLTPSLVLKDGLLPATLRPSPSVEQPSAHCDTPKFPPLAITSAVSIKSTQSHTALTLSNSLDDYDYPTEPQSHSPPSEPYLIPLPPSPSPSSSSSFLRSEEDLAFISLTASFPLPPSSGLDPSPASPIISITPPTIHASVPPFHSSTGSKSSHLTPVSDIASLPAPTLDTSVTTTFPNSLDDDDAVITESPVEIPLTGLSSISSRPRTSKDLEVPVASYASAAGSANLPRARLRNFTDPTSGGLKTYQVEPPKSFNPFKRSTDPSPNNISPRRLSMGVSLNNIRRSLVGTLSRTKAGGFVRAEKGFDASHLPPSPTLPAAYADQAGVSPVNSTKLSPTFLHQQQHLASPELKLRVSVSPTLYSRGTIVAETNNIEDEETRRMTELAFLG